MTEGAIVSLGKSVVGALRRDPMMLAFMLVVLTFLVMIYFGVSARRAMDHELLKQILATCLPAGAK